MADILKAKGGLKTFTTFTVTTAATGLSNIVDIQGMCPRAIQMSTAWTAANLTFMGAINSTGSMQSIRKTTAGTEVTYTSTLARINSLDPNDFAGIRFLQIRSGTTTTPVAQAAERALIVSFTAVDNLD